MYPRPTNGESPQFAQTYPAVPQNPSQFAQFPFPQQQPQPQPFQQQQFIQNPQSPQYFRPMNAYPQAPSPQFAQTYPAVPQNPSQFAQFPFPQQQPQPQPQPFQQQQFIQNPQSPQYFQPMNAYPQAPTPVLQSPQFPQSPSAPFSQFRNQNQIYPSSVVVGSTVPLSSPSPPSSSFMNAPLPSTSSGVLQYPSLSSIQKLQQDEIRETTNMDAGGAVRRHESLKPIQLQQQIHPPLSRSASISSIDYSQPRSNTIVSPSSTPSSNNSSSSSSSGSGSSNISNSDIYSAGVVSLSYSSSSTRPPSKPLSKRLSFISDKSKKKGQVYTDEWIKAWSDDDNKDDSSGIFAIFPLPLTTISSKEKTFLWENRRDFFCDARFLPRLASSIEWELSSFRSEKDQLKVMFECAIQAGSLSIPHALELLCSTNNTCRDMAVRILASSPAVDIADLLLALVQALKNDDLIQLNQGQSKLLVFLFEQCLRSFLVGSRFFWFTTVESQLPRCTELFKMIQWKFMTFLNQRVELTLFHDMIGRQQKLDAKLAQICRMLSTSMPPGTTRQKKIETLRSCLSPEAIAWNWEEVFGRPYGSIGLYLPMHQEFKVTGIKASEASIFKSAKQPLFLTFSTDSGRDYKVIYKCGDDLRQDQLVIQLFSICDKTLREKGNLDLRPCPYRVMATGLESGFVEMVVPSITMTSLLADFQGGVQEYLRVLEFAPSPSAALVSQAAISESATRLDNFVRSNAFYAVVTYIFGVGDRHFENILLTDDGKLFHIDFGFLFGNDPKPNPPPIRFCREIVDGMGGVTSPHFERFVELTCQAYLILRKFASAQIVQYLCLMASASIPQLSLNPKVGIHKVVKRFRLDLDEVAAKDHMKNVIWRSLKNQSQQINEALHKIAVSLKQ